MQKIIVYVCLCAILFLNGCSIANLTTKNPRKQLLIYQEFEQPDNLEFKIDWEKEKNNYPSLVKNNQPIVFPSFQALYHGDETLTEKQNQIFEENKNILTVYAFSGEEYSLQSLLDPNNPEIPEIFEITNNNGEVILKSEMCYAADGPISDFRKIDQDMAIGYLRGQCNYENTDSWPIKDIFYKNKNINDIYGVEESKSLFLFENTTGFFGKKDGQWYVHFNEKQISKGYDDVLTFGCCATPYLFELYDNGVLAFLAKKDGKNYVVEIDLNQF